MPGSGAEEVILIETGKTVAVETLGTGYLATIYGWGQSAATAVSSITSGSIFAVGAVAVAGIGVWKYGDYCIAQENRKMFNDMFLNTKCPDGFYAKGKMVDGNPEVTCMEVVGFKEKIEAVSASAEENCSLGNYRISVTPSNEIEYHCISLHGDNTADVFE